MLLVCCGCIGNDYRHVDSDMGRSGRLETYDSMKTDLGQLQGQISTTQTEVTAIQKILESQRVYSS